MSRAPFAGAAIVLGVASAAALLWAAGGDDESIAAIRPSDALLAARYPLAASGAYGRRVLVLHDHGARVTGDVFESARIGGRWELYPSAPPGATQLAERLAGLAGRAAADLQAEKRLSDATVDALARHSVAFVLIENGKLVVDPAERMRSARLSVDTALRGLRVQGAELVWRLTDDGEELAPVLDPSDGLWGGGVVVDAPEAGTYRFAWGLHGARVKVNGEFAKPAVVAPPDDVFLHLHLPAGRSRVDVSYVDDGARGVVAILGGAGLVVALITLLLLFRPRLSHDLVE